MDCVVCVVMLLVGFSTGMFDEGTAWGSAEASTKDCSSLSAEAGSNICAAGICSSDPVEGAIGAGPGTEGFCVALPSEPVAAVVTTSSVILSRWRSFYIRCMGWRRQGWNNSV